MRPARLALVTGASRGLGAALALALAARGWHVLAVARTQGALEDLDDRIRAAGGAATLAPLDLTDDAAPASLARGIHDRWGRLDLWAHAAVHAPSLTPADHVDARDLARAVALNLTATAQLLAQLAPLLRAAEGAGRALFLDDPCAGTQFCAGYGATKAAQIALARSWQAEGARIGPKVHIETPRPMPTALRARFYPGEDRARLADPAQEAARILAAVLGPAQPA
jgi:NAD(P)-dependent dehydrogenase (short-subunit alcohol dehydrogenase family)